jgi:hypothetical protein
VAVRVKVRELGTFTVVLDPVTAPTPLSMESEVAPVTCQSSVTGPPPAAREDGVAVKEAMVGRARAATLTVAVDVPPGPVAVSVKVVLEVTDVVVLVPVTVPTPWSMETVPAPVTCHESVTGPPPSGSVDGLAVKLATMGAPPPPPPAPSPPAPHATGRTVPRRTAAFHHRA